MNKKEIQTYADFVKANYSKVKDLPHKERFKKIGDMWKKQKESKNTPKLKNKKTNKKKCNKKKCDCDLN